MSRAGIQDRKQLFCDHCKMIGHTVKKCYKIHGYPPGHRLSRGRRMATSVQIADDVQTNNVNCETYADAVNASMTTVPALTSEQYNQLMQVLSKYNTEQGQGSNDAATAAGFLAGKTYCFLSTADHHTWIIDSGASDHITSDLSLLNDVKPMHQDCYITMPNGKKVQIKHTGSMLLAPGLVLKNVLHVL